MYSCLFKGRDAEFPQNCAMDSRMWIISAAVLLAVNLALSAHVTSAGFYVVARLGIILLFAFAACRFGTMTRSKALVWAAFLGFLDQVIFKGVFLTLEFKKDPTVLQGHQLWEAYTGLTLSYVMFFPFVLLLAFLGTELAKVRVNAKHHS
jgi:hypothetical protein